MRKYPWGLFALTAVALLVMVVSAVWITHQKDAFVEACDEMGGVAVRSPGGGSECIDAAAID